MWLFEILDEVIGTPLRLLTMDTSCNESPPAQTSTVKSKHDPLVDSLGIETIPSDTNDFFMEIEKQGISMSIEQKDRISKKVNAILSYEPVVGVFGKTGVGKSSLCNALFGKDICPIDDIMACTRSPKAILLGLGQKGIKLVDVPGVGENRLRDEEYAKLYSKLLPHLDLVLWIIKADDRAMTSDETFYKNIVKPHISEGKAFFFVLNQVDKVEPFREWDIQRQKPGAKQFLNIHKRIEHLSSFFEIASSKIIPVSANRKYNLIELVDEIVFSLPKEKKYIIPHSQ